MTPLSDEEKHAQCLREIKGTLLVVLLCCLWHVGTAFLLNGKDWRFLGTPAWFSVSVLGSVLILFIGLWLLMKYVFINFDYTSEETEEQPGGKQP